MTAISEIFDKHLSDVLLSVYWRTLEPYTDEQCEKAFNELITTSRFLPKPVDIIEAIEGTQNEKAIEAWGKVLAAMETQGAYSSVKFDDPVIHSAINMMGGWVKVARTPYGEEKWAQKEFERLYMAMAKHDEHPSYLPGQHEIENGEREFFNPPVKKIEGGDDERRQKKLL